MSHTHASVLVHCVFSTKQRANLIPNPESLWRYLAVVARDKKITLLAAAERPTMFTCFLRSRPFCHWRRPYVN